MADERASDDLSQASASHAIKVPHPTVVVGLDFGTHATGFAYCELSGPGLAGGGAGAGGADPRVMLHLSWPDQPTADPKTRTAVLYRGRHLEAWGWTAWRRWSSMSRDERTAGGYTFLTGFKLLLEDGDGGGGHGRGHGGDGDFEDAAASEMGHCPERLRSLLRASLPPGMTVVHVVTDFLGALRR
ncbi:hypothetical protein PLESTF_000812700 [Pleodorina starrii]|nr:hypothetical protein PLESTF_000812700 [Pleodorina starrii]